MAAINMLSEASVIKTTIPADIFPFFCSVGAGGCGWPAAGT